MPSDSAAKESSRSAERGLGESDIRTFLIADVRGYTRFTQEQGDEEAGALAAKFAKLARETVAGRKGELIELRGDEALCVFTSAREALRAAVDFQVRFRANTDDGPAFPLGIGIGLDAGEAVPIEGGYRGSALNLASRLCALTRPGEILASETVVGLAGRLDGVRFLDRRAVRLKGIARPVRVTEIAPAEPLPSVPAPARRRRLDARWLVAGTVVGIALVGALVALGIARSTGQEWLDGVHANAVGVIDPDAGRIADEVAVGAGPRAIAVGVGSLWVTNGVDGTVSRIDPETHDVQTIPVGAGPVGVAVGGGAAWVANNGDRTVSRISIDSNKVVQTIPVGNGPSAVAVGEGAVWVANFVDGTVSRIDVDNGAVKTIPVGANPSAIGISNDAVWVASEATGTVAGVDPRSGAVRRSVNVGNAPVAIAADENTIWVANKQDGTVSRIDPRSAAVTGIARVGGRPTAVAIGPGAVWVIDADAGTLARVDPADGKITKRIALESSPTAVAFAAGSVWTTATASAASHRGGVLRVESQELSWCDCLDPVAAWSEGAWRIMPLLYDGLVGHKRVGGAAGGTVVADLATSVPVPSEDGKTYTFQMRRGVRYSDGELVKATDVRFSLERLFKVGVPAVGVPFYDHIVGAAGCVERPETCDLSEGVDADDRTGTVTIRLTEPDSDFLSKLALPFAYILPATTPLKMTQGPELVGTGPYRIASYEPKKELRLVRNPKFRVWSPDAQPAGYPDEIGVRIGDDVERQIDAVAAGKADWVAGIPPDRVQDLGARYGAQLHSDPLSGLQFLFLNVRTAPFDDVRVRRALNLAVNRGRVADLAGAPISAQPTCQILPPSFPGYRPYCPYTLDPSPAGIWTAPDVARATGLIEQSGTSGARVRILAPGDQPERLEVGRYLAGLLRQLGYRAALHVFPEEEAYYEFIGDPRNEAQVGATGWFADYAAPANFLQINFSCRFGPLGTAGNPNFSQFCDPRIDSLMSRAAAAQTAEPARASELWAQVDRAVTDAAPAIPLYTPRVAVLVSDRVGNYQFHPLWQTLFDQLWVK